MEQPSAMKRILVTGNAGSGKSTLARHIADYLELPCHGLDSIVWQTGWEKTPARERDRRMRALVEGDSWVIDGVSNAALAAADTVVFLDVPRRICFPRVARRNWRYLFRSRPGLPPGCPEILIIPALCRIIWNFPRRIRPAILDHMNGMPAERAFRLVTAADHAAFRDLLGKERLAMEERGTEGLARREPDP